MKVRFEFGDVRSMSYIRGSLLLVLGNGRELWFNDTEHVSCEVSDGEKRFDALEDNVAGDRADGLRGVTGGPDAALPGERA